MPRPKTGLRWHADLRGEDGNAFVVMGVVHKAIKSSFGEDWEEEARKAGERMRSGDYEHLLEVAREYVDIVDHPTGFLQRVDERAEEDNER